MSCTPGATSPQGCRRADSLYIVQKTARIEDFVENCVIFPPATRCSSMMSDVPADVISRIYPDLQIEKGGLIPFSSGA
jgi:hypothetical protein